jgi:hypothetical protein
MIEPLDGGRMSEIKLMHSDLANNDFEDTDKNWSYFIGRLVEHCKDKQQRSSDVAINIEDIMSRSLHVFVGLACVGA